jgi:hypothetical protein
MWVRAGARGLAALLQANFATILDIALCSCMICFKKNQNFQNWIKHLANIGRKLIDGVKA